MVCPLRVKSRREGNIIGVAFERSTIDSLNTLKRRWWFTSYFISTDAQNVEVHVVGRFEFNAIYCIPLFILMKVNESWIVLKDFKGLFFVQICLTNGINWIFIRKFIRHLCLLILHFMNFAKKKCIYRQKQPPENRMLWEYQYTSQKNVYFV